MKVVREETLSGAACAGLQCPVLCVTLVIWELWGGSTPCPLQVSELKIKEVPSPAELTQEPMGSPGLAQPPSTFLCSSSFKRHLRQLWGGPLLAAGLSGSWPGQSSSQGPSLCLASWLPGSETALPWGQGWVAELRSHRLCPCT